MCVIFVIARLTQYKWLWDLWGRRWDHNGAEAGPIGGAQLCSIVAGGSEVDLVLTCFDIA